MKREYLGKICFMIWGISSMAMAFSILYLKWFSGEVIALFSLAIWIFSFLDAWEPNKQIDKTNQLIEDILKSLNSIQQHTNHQEKWDEENDKVLKLSSKRDNLHQMKKLTHRINRHTNTKKHTW